MIETLEDRTVPAPVSGALAGLVSQADAAVAVAQGITQQVLFVNGQLSVAIEGTEAALAIETSNVATQSEAALTFLRNLESQLNATEQLAITQENSANPSDTTALAQKLVTVEAQTSALTNQLKPLEAQLLTLSHDLASGGFAAFAAQIATQDQQASGLINQISSIDGQLANLESQVASGSGAGSQPAGAFLTSTTFVNAQAFVTQLFTDLLGRQPSSTELANVTNAITSQGATQRNIIDSILGSTEYLSREVQMSYSQILGRSADAAGLNAWVSYLQSGRTVEQLRGELAASDEFFAQAGSTNSGFLTLLYQRVLNRAPDQLGELGLLQGIASGGSRFGAALGIVTSPEAQKDLIQSDYTTFLGRQADPQGLAAWSNLLQQVGDDSTVLADFLTASNEFVNHALAVAGLPTIPTGSSPGF
jgi:hypothetical protein